MIEVQLANIFQPILERNLGHIFVFWQVIVRLHQSFSDLLIYKFFNQPIIRFYRIKCPRFTLIF
ncbi:hypothetical protein, partial [Listeria monocytogenes]|uniref:hypothetical protein n=1 Tax=Listeria monocytogenes TaxID=1639 RepID=UPI00406BAD3C